MEGRFGGYICSPLFTFRIGPDKKEIIVHSGSLASLSPALNTLMNGKMVEAKDRCVDWSDVDEGTFIRLCEYAYLRDYTPPSPIEKIDEKSEGVEPKPEPESEPEPYSDTEPQAEQEFGWGDQEGRLSFDWGAPRERGLIIERQPSPFDGHRLPCTDKGIYSRELCDRLMDMDLDLSAHEEASLDTFSPRGNTSPSEDFNPVFLGHVRLYILADKYGIESLRQLVLQKLQATLRDFTICQQNVDAIAEFVRFTYANTPYLGDKRDPLRNLVVNYAASVLGVVGDQEAFRELLGEGGDFVVDFWQIACR